MRSTSTRSGSECSARAWLGPARLGAVWAVNSVEDFQRESSSVGSATTFKAMPTTPLGLDIKLAPAGWISVRDVVAEWRGAPPVVVVNSPSELPVRNAPTDARGLYSSGKAWIVAKSPRQDSETLAHEVIAHHGLRKSLGGQVKSFFYAVQDGIAGGDPTLKRIRSYVRSVYVDDRGQPVLNRSSEADEIAAVVAEARFDGKRSRLVIEDANRKMSKATANRIARDLLYLDRPADLEEVEGALLIAEHQVRHGGPFWGLGYRWKRWYARPMAKFDPRKPPMSLAQSEFLLREESDQQQSKSDRKGLFLVLQLVLAAILLGAGILGFFWNVGSIFGFLR